jgi:hypothetical protein
LWRRLRRRLRCVRGSVGHLGVWEGESGCGSLISGWQRVEEVQSGKRVRWSFFTMRSGGELEARGFLFVGEQMTFKRKGAEKGQENHFISKEVEYIRVFCKFETL